jgi:hypothetical protein
MKGLVVSVNVNGIVIRGEDDNLYSAAGYQFSNGATVIFKPDPINKGVALDVQTIGTEDTVEPQTKTCSIAATQPVLPTASPLIDLSVERVRGAVKTSITTAESLYKKSLWYCEEYKAEKKITGKFVGNLGWAPTESFEKTKSQMVFQKLPDVKSSDALQAFFAGTETMPTICECHSMLVACYYDSIKSMLGVELFDKCFPEFQITSVMGYAGSPIKQLFVGIRADAEFQVGDWTVFNNHPFFPKRHPADTTAQGWNIICVETQPEIKWLGFGLGKLVTTEELSKMMYDFFVAPPTEADLKQIDVQYKQMLGGKFNSGQLSDIMEEFKKGEAEIQVDGSPCVIGIDKKKTKRLSPNKIGELVKKYS